MSSASSSPRTVEEIFKDYNARRSALVRALTFDVEEFYSQCDPEKENLCLYGHPNESWEVTMPADEVPPEIPEPALGINFSRDGMRKKDWLSLVAVHSDCWLVSVAFYFGARLNRNERFSLVENLFFAADQEISTMFWDILGELDQLISVTIPKSQCRKRLFSLINDLPTLFEVVTGRMPLKDKPSADGGSKSRNSTKRSIDGLAKSNPELLEESLGEVDDAENDETFCGSCGGSYNSDQFWIGCDVCEQWYHGKCVKITPAKAENIKQYKCPSCSSKKGRH